MNFPLPVCRHGIQYKKNMYIITILYEQVTLCMYVREFSQLSSPSLNKLGLLNRAKAI